MSVPVTGDLGPGRDPYAVVAPDMVEEAHQRSRAPGPTRETAMQADRHHLWALRSFGIKDIEGVAQVAENASPWSKPLWTANFMSLLSSV